MMGNIVKSGLTQARNQEPYTFVYIQEGANRKSIGSFCLSFHRIDEISEKTISRFFGSGAHASVFGLDDRQVTQHIGAEFKPGGCAAHSIQT